LTTKIKPKEQKIIQQAQLLISQNNTETAKDILLKYTKKNKASLNTTYLLSLSHAVLGELNEALGPATILARKDANNIEYLKLLGGIYHGLKKYDQAIDIFHRVLKLNNQDFQTLSNLASSLKETHQYEDAESYFQQSLAIQANQPDALTNYGLLMQANAKLDEAIQLHKKALQFAPDHGSALYNLAYSLNEKGDKEASSLVYTDVLKKMPDHIRALCDASQIYGALKQPEQALELLTHAKSISPEDEHVHINLGVTYKVMDMLDEAEASFNEANRLNPGNHTAKYYLAIMKGDNSIASSPEQYVQELFDGYAETFDGQLVEQLKYEIPELISNIVSTHTDKDKKYKILDLGCGTGLAGLYLQNISDYMVGVDLSEKMLKKAGERNIYDEFIVASIDQYFVTSTFKPNIIVAADVFVYIGDLSSIFTAVENIAQPGSIFVFSTEDNPECNNFELRDSGR